MSTYDKASLVLIPSGTKEGVVFSQKPTNGDGDFTFSRASAATRVNADGLIEKERTNYVPYSQDFSQWSVLGGATITTGVTDPNNGSTAATISNISAGNLSDGAAIYNNPMIIGTGNVVSQSIYLKGSGTIAIAAERGVSGSYFVFDKIVTLSATWQRFDNFAQIAGAANGFHFYISNKTGTTATSVDIAFAQFEIGTAPSEYIVTNGSAVITGITDNIPRLDYTDASCPSLLLEGQRTNSFPQSEYPSTSTLNLVNGGYTWTHNQINSPEGVQNASKWAAANNNAVVGVYQNFSATSGTYYTFSVFAKKGDHNFIQLQNGGGGSGANSYANFDLENGTKSDGLTITDAFIDDFGNGWYRCGITFSISSTTTSNCSIDIIDSLSAGRNSTFTGSIGDYFYVWGMQVEASSYATSYIPTYGSSVTKLADVCSGAGTADLFNDSEGVLYAEIKGENDGTFNYISISDGGTTNYVGILYTDADNEIIYRYYVGGSGVQLVVNDIVVTNFNKIAVKWKANDFAIWINGIELGTASSGSLNPSGTFNELAFARGGSNNTPFYGNVKQVLVFTTALTDAELAALTTI